MIASRLSRAYPGGVTLARLVRMFALLAMLIAPLGMMNGHATMTADAIAAPAAHHDATMSEGHCDESAPRPAEPSAPERDCLLDCAATCSVVPPAAGTAGHPFFLAAEPDLAPASPLRGHQPESDPPPPRA